MHQQTQSCPHALTQHRVIAFAGATASAGPGGATATAGGGGIAAGVAAAASEAVTHAQNGNCFAAQVALMAAQQQLALTTGENNLTAPKKGRIRHEMAAVQVALMVPQQQLASTTGRL